MWKRGGACISLSVRVIWTSSSSVADNRFMLAGCRTPAVVGALVSALVLSACGSTAPSPSHRSGSAPDAGWYALSGCLKKTVEPSPPRQDVPFPSSGQLRIYADNEAWVASMTYKGTFARARIAARAKLRSRFPIRNRGTGGGLAIANIFYYFTGATSTPVTQDIVDCLERTYPRAQRWPADLALSSLSISPPHPPGS